MNLVVRSASILLISLVFLAAEGQARTWKVGRQSFDCDGPCDFFDGSDAGDGIKQAMNWPAVAPGDTVMVWPGNCPPLSGGYALKFNMKSGVVLISKAGPDSTLICGSAGFEPAIAMINCSASTVIEGFTISWGSTETGLGGGIGCFASSGIIRNNIFRNCLAGTGAGVYQEISNVLVTNNLFINNRCEAGAGVIALSGGNPTIENNTFVGCEAPFGTDSSVLYASGSTYTFDRNIVYGSRGAPAVFCGGTNTPLVTYNLFWDNELGAYAGGCADSTGSSGNRAADPLFCAPTATDLPGCSNICVSDGLRGTYSSGAPFRYGVCADSPAVTGPGGKIGYTSLLGDCAPCDSTMTAVATIETSTWGKIKALYKSP